MATPNDLVTGAIQSLIVQSLKKKMSAKDFDAVADRLYPKLLAAVEDHLLKRLQQNKDYLDDIVYDVMRSKEFTRLLRASMVKALSND
jgi:hypothetical protein